MEILTVIRIRRCWFTVWKAKYGSHRNHYPHSFRIFKLFFPYPD